MRSLLLLGAAGTRTRNAEARLAKNPPRGGAYLPAAYRSRTAPCSYFGGACLRFLGSGAGLESKWLIKNIPTFAPSPKAISAMVNT